MVAVQVVVVLRRQEGRLELPVCWAFAVQVVVVLRRQEGRLELPACWAFSVQVVVVLRRQEGRLELSARWASEASEGHRWALLVLSLAQDRTGSSRCFFLVPLPIDRARSPLLRRRQALGWQLGLRIRWSRPG